MMEEKTDSNLYQAVKNNDSFAVRRELLSHTWDLTKHYGSEGNVVNISIQNDSEKDSGHGVMVLAALLGIVYPLQDEGIKTTLAKDRDILLRDSCDKDGLLPLIKAAKVGSHACLTLLISCGAGVNDKTKRGERAIDFSLDQDDPRITLVLLEHDSLFPISKSQLLKLESLIKGHREFRELFQLRNSIHNDLKNGILLPRVRESLRKGKYRYFVDENGVSALYRAGLNEERNIWAILLSMEMDYSSMREENAVKRLREIDEDNFNRALDQVFHIVEGCHIMKMVSKSLTFGKYENSRGLGKRFESIYRSLDEEDYTAVLMEVLQDVPGFQVVFDFGSTNVKRVRAREFKDEHHGVTDFELNRVYVGAMETDVFHFSDVVSNLAHELAHRAMHEVFQNNGLPFRKGDLKGSEKVEGCPTTVENDKGPGDIYMGIVHKIFSPERFDGCDDIIKRVRTCYDETKWGKELIVRVPEMVAKYRRHHREVGEEPNGVDLLKLQAEELLNFYKKFVMPEFRKFIQSGYTRGKITLRAVQEYQKLLSSSQVDQIEVNSSNISDVDFYLHGNLKTLKVSNLSLGQSHLRVKSIEKDILFVDWSNYVKFKGLFMEGMKRGEFKKLVVTWDLKERPKFCSREVVCLDTCPGRAFGDLVECVVMLLHKEFPVLLKSQAMEYLWEDLSEETQDLIMKKRLDFGGIVLTVREVIQTVENEQDVRKCASKYLDSSEIAYLLDEKNVKLSKAACWPEPEEDRKTFLSHKECYIERSLYRYYVELNEKVLQENKDTFFFAGNVNAKYFHELGIKEELVSKWNELHPNQNARCYVLDDCTTKSGAYEAFDSIVRYHMRKKTVCKIHFLNMRVGKLFCIKSVSLRGHSIKTKSHESEAYMCSDIISNILGMDDFFNDDPILISDNPGCGKSVYLSKLAMDIKKDHGNCWISFVELRVKEQQKYLEKLQDCRTEEIEAIFFDLVKSGCSSFERKLFTHFIQERNKFFALFDGFDEICPKYKEGVTNFLKILQRSTGVKIIVTTRMHERHDLERALDSIAFSLVPFTIKEQVKFLGAYWNALLSDLTQEERMLKFCSMHSGISEWLSDGEGIAGVLRQLESANALQRAGQSSRNYPTMKYKELDFGPVAKKLMDSGNIFTEGPEQFTHTPLHVQMAGLTIYEDSFNTRHTRNLGHLYIRFFEIKMRIFVREKARNYGSVPAETLMKMGQKMASIILENLSANFFQERKVYDFKSSDMLVALSIGLVTESAAEAYQFVHRSFGEFFFAKWLLRKIRKKQVTKFWLKQLFHEEWLSGVRYYLEDILRLLSEGVLSSDNDNVLLIQDKCLLNGKALPEMELWECISRCLYVQIHDCHERSLQLMAESFRGLPKLFLVDQNSLELALPEESLLSQSFKDHMNLHKWKVNKMEKYCNTLTFAAYCLEEVTQHPGNKYTEVIKMMLNLMECHRLIDRFNDLLVENGFEWLFPYYVFKEAQGGDTASMYCSEVVGFLMKNVDMLRGTLMEAFLQDRRGVFCSIGQKDFELLTSLADIIFDESGFSQVLWGLDNSIVYLWRNAVTFSKLEHVLRIWSYIESKLVGNERKLEFLLRRHWETFSANVLALSGLNKDARVIGFVWELGRSLMDVKKITEWLLESFGGTSLFLPDGMPCVGFYNLISSMLEEKLITKEEVHGLFLTVDQRNKHYLIKFTAFPSFNAIFSFYNFFSKCLRSGAAGDILRSMDCPYSRIIMWLLGVPFTETFLEDLRKFVELEFEQITVQDTRGLLEPIPADGVFIGRDRRNLSAEQFKIIMVILSKQVTLEGEYLGKDYVFKRLLPPEYEPVDKKVIMVNEFYVKTLKPSILHHVVECGNALVIRYICGILLQVLEPKDMEELFKSVDLKGDTVFHRGLKEEERFDGFFQNLREIGLKVFGEGGVTEISEICNSDGKTVDDILREKEEEEKEMFEWLEELNAALSTPRT